MAFNFGQAAGFVALMPSAVEQSEILLRPLSPQARRRQPHRRRVLQRRATTMTWKTLRDWAEAVRSERSPHGTLVKTAGETFFEEHVMPKLLQRGCALEGCHSPDGFNDFRLRSGREGVVRAAARCAATTRRRCTSSWRSTPSTSSSRAR